jgi:hypothetical protein
MPVEDSNIKNTQPYEVDGYRFYTEKDAKLAQLELRKIQYLSNRIDYDRPESVLRVYDKAVSERIFMTPVGIKFLRELREFLLNSPKIPNEKIQPIPMTGSFDNEIRSKSTPAKKRVKPSEKKDPKSQALAISVMINIVLVVAILAMFVITLNSDQPNVLNYEKAITDKYASWEQQLTERENAVREKERELDIQTE